MENISTITIRIKDGIIVQVEDIPNNIVIKVVDYDTDGGTGLSVIKDKYDKDCYIYYYDSNDCRKEDI